MTRKRFVRLVMSYEIQRNEAERIAGNVAQYGNYEKMFAEIKEKLIMRRDLTRVKRSWKWFKTGIIKAAKNNMRYLVPVIRTMTKIVSEAQEAEREREIARANLAYMADGGITAWMN